MSQFLCIDEENDSAIGNTIEEAYENYRDEINCVSIDNLTFYELNNPIKARFSLIIDGGA